MTPTPYALTFFQEREHDARVAYEEQINSIAKDWNIEGWHNARDLREDWRNARLDWLRADGATPCQHTTAERHSTAQYCDWCWSIVNYVRLTEDDNDE